MKFMYLRMARTRRWSHKHLPVHEDECLVSRGSERDWTDTTLLEAYFSVEIVGCSWTHISADNLTEKLLTPSELLYWAIQGPVQVLDGNVTSMLMVTLYIKTLSYSSPHVSTVIKFQEMRWAGLASHMGKRWRTCMQFCSGNLRRRGNC
jgi:hypothetical protein